MEQTKGDENEGRIANGRYDISIIQKNKVHFLVEIKKISCSLNKSHRGQLFKYAKNYRHVDWAILTNGPVLELYKNDKRG